jgi:predicted DsbA family dithiol-disulfide isomerase
VELRIDIWSDIACPWCWIGQRRLAAALERFPGRDAVRVVWRAFELDPSKPAVDDAGGPYAERLARKYATSRERAEDMIRTMTEAAAGVGLDYRFDRIRPGNTFDTHRLAHFAAGRGLGDAAQERLMRAYLTDGEALGLRETLVRLAGEIGLDPAEARAALASDAFAREVRADEAEARARGITGVPHFVIGRHAIGGAQPPELLLPALDAAWRELEPDPERTDAGACGPDGCG